jgi:hypothetical protein
LIFFSGSLIILLFHSAENSYKEALKQAMNVLEASLGANAPAFFAQFDGDGDGEVDFITFLHCGYAAEHNGRNDQICKSFHATHFTVTLPRGAHQFSVQKHQRESSGMAWNRISEKCHPDPQILER